ncbi:MAG: phosphoglycerate kinase [bacterium]|nr:phosphoglycerate kinase [bacterium]
MLSLIKQPVTGKRVLVRADFNVSFESDGKTIADDFRIRAALPTIQWLCDQGAKVVLMSHLGRPIGGKEEQKTLEPIAKYLAKCLKKPVLCASDCVGSDVEDDVLAMQNGDVIMLENLRFHKGETENDPIFAKKLARLGEAYVNDAFGVSHRAHASVSAITKFLPAYTGFLLEKELETLSGVLTKPKKPLVLVIGGAKIETKLPIIKNLLPQASKVLVGGAVANTFFAAKGLGVGASKIETEFIPHAKRILKSSRIVLPSDVLATPNPLGRARIKFRSVRTVRDGEMILDIGPKTTEQFAQIITKAATVVWNGPMGLFEIPAFAHGTIDLARAIGAADGFSIVGGGETVTLLRKLKLESKITYISTGGGAMLEFLGGKKLPGLEALGYYRKARSRK